MAADTLLVVLGDSPRMPTGLGRIAGDLAAHLWSARERLNVELLQIGWEYGAPTLYPLPWPLVAFPDIRQDWSCDQVVRIVDQHRRYLGLDTPEVVLFSVWDPARCFEYRDLGFQKWGYFAVDGHNRNKTFGGPAAEAVRSYDRVLAYTRYGAEILSNVISGAEWRSHMAPGVSRVQYLPHGHYWDDSARQRAEMNAEPPQQGWRLGCVASNTPRKDLGLFFATLRWLRDSGERVYGWLHTDELVTGAWSIPELLEVYEIDPTWIEITLPPMHDAVLQARYASCAVTLAVGRGEGFGYPIVESQAMGRAVVHCDYGGGAEFTPQAGLVAPRTFDGVNPYCIERPLLAVDDVAHKCAALAREALEGGVAPYYAGNVAHLHWSQVWPRWETWFRQGLTELRERR